MSVIGAAITDHEAVPRTVDAFLDAADGEQLVEAYRDVVRLANHGFDVIEMLDLHQQLQLACEAGIVQAEFLANARMEARRLAATKLIDARSSEDELRSRIHEVVGVALALVAIIADTCTGRDRDAALRLVSTPLRSADPCAGTVPRNSEPRDDETGLPRTV